MRRVACGRRKLFGLTSRKGHAVPASLLERDVTTAFYGEADEADLTAAIAELRGHAVTQQTLAEAHRWSREAVEALAPLPQGPVKKALTRFAETGDLT